jgi:hypothetical protein
MLDIDLEKQIWIKGNLLNPAEMEEDLTSKTGSNRFSLQPKLVAIVSAHPNVRELCQNPKTF